MRDKRVRRLPVVDQQMQLQGMVSISDFIRCDGVDRTLLYDTLNGICQRSCKIEGNTASMSKAA
jgi:CBS-domain-containing membrane protein